MAIPVPRLSLSKVIQMSSLQTPSVALSLPSGLVPLLLLMSQPVLNLSLKNSQQKAPTKHFDSLDSLCSTPHVSTPSSGNSRSDPLLILTLYPTFSSVAGSSSAAAWGLLLAPLHASDWRHPTAICKGSQEGFLEIYRTHKATCSCFSCLYAAVLGVPALPKAGEMWITCYQKGEGWTCPGKGTKYPCHEEPDGLAQEQERPTRQG